MANEIALERQITAPNVKRDRACQGMADGTSI
jgi:hypothetical protein